MRRPLLYIAAALFFVYEQIAIYQWLQQNGSVAAGLQHAWRSLTADPALFMAWNDMAVFTAIVLVWLWRDLNTSGLTRLYWFATLLMGCPPLLVYLARRTPSRLTVPHHAESVGG
jgi:hypothetical protein